jgi:hypothetical protein
VNPSKFQSLLNISNLTWVNHGVIWLTFFSYFGIMFVVTSFKKLALYYVMPHVFAELKSWLVVLLCSVIAIIPIAAISSIAALIRPSKVHILRETIRKRTSLILDDDAEEQTPLLNQL